MAIATSYNNKKLSADVIENLQFFNYRISHGSTFQIVDTIEIPLDTLFFSDREVIATATLIDYDVLNQNSYKEKIEKEILRNPSHLINIKKTQTITLKEVIKELNESYELFCKDWDDYRTQKAELLELEEKENSE